VRADKLIRRTGAPLALAVCTGPLERARGLLRRPAPPPGSALWIAPCRAVHTCGMRYPIDVVFLDDRGLVVRLDAAVPPWRVVAHRDATSVLELRAGECDRLRIRQGERLLLPAREVVPPAAARREPTPRPALLLALAAALTIAWMLGGCASPPENRTRPSARDAVSVATAAPVPIDELVLAAGLEYDSRAWGAAEAAYTELTRRQPDHGEHWYRLGVIYLRTARADAAAHCFQVAARLGARPGVVDQSLATARLVQAAEALHRARAAAVREGATRLGPRELPAAPVEPPARLDRAIATLQELLPESLAGPAATHGGVTPDGRVAQRGGVTP
jgi:uncharacterized protein